MSAMLGLITYIGGNRRVATPPLTRVRGRTSWTSPGFRVMESVMIHIWYIGGAVQVEELRVGHDGAMC